MAGSVPAAPPKQFGAGNEAGGEDNSSDADGGQLYQFTFEQALGWPSVTGLQDPTIEPDVRRLWDPFSGLLVTLL